MHLLFLCLVTLQANSDLLHLEPTAKSAEAPPPEHVSDSSEKVADQAGGTVSLP